jgi:DNA invertase Pin-like site-specific DNA recombinase
MDAVAYVRVSTGEQTVDHQKKAIEEFSKQYEFKIIKWFEDINTSGSKKFFEREKVLEMLEFCKANEVSVIIMYDLTRFGRYDPVDVLNDIKRLREEGFRIVFVAEPQIEDEHFRKLWEFIKGWYAEYERIQISQRTRLKILHKMKMGELAHRPTMYHYFASVYFNKLLGEVTTNDIEKVKPIIRIIVEKALEKGVKKKKLLDYLRSEDKYFRLIYERYPKAPKSYWVVWKMLKELNLER